MLEKISLNTKMLFAFLGPSVLLLVVDLRALIQGKGAIAKEAPEKKVKQVKKLKNVNTPVKKVSSVAKKDVSDIIPFDDEDSRKVGNVSGF